MNLPFGKRETCFLVFHCMGTLLTCSFNWSSSGSQYRQKRVSSWESRPSCLRGITSDRLHPAVICPSMDKELCPAEMEISLQPVERLTIRLRAPLSWRQVPQKLRYRSCSLVPEGDKRQKVAWCCFFLKYIRFKLNCSDV